MLYRSRDCGLLIAAHGAMRTMFVATFFFIQTTNISFSMKHVYIDFYVMFFSECFLFLFCASSTPKPTVLLTLLDTAHHENMVRPL